jgi:hypothetical protein
VPAKGSAAALSPAGLVGGTDECNLSSAICFVMGCDPAAITMVLAHAILQPLMRTKGFKRYLPLLLILVLGAFLRFYQMDGFGLWSDEFVTLQLATQPTYPAVVRTCFAIPQPIPPLYFLLEKASVDWLGASEISLRLLSAFSGTLTIVLLFWLGKELVGAEAGGVAALLFSLQPAQMVYAQNARAYAFCLMLSAAAVLAFLKWMKTGRAASQVFFVISTTLLFYSHYVFAPLMLVLNVYFFGTFFWGIKKALVSWKRWLGLQLLVGLLLLPLAGQMQQLLRARHSLNWSSHVPELQDFFSFVNFPSLRVSLIVATVLWLAWVIGRWVLGKCGRILLVGLLLLLGQMLQLFRARHLLNWSSHVPELKDLFRLVDFPFMKTSLLVATALWLAWVLGRWVLEKYGRLQKASSPIQVARQNGDPMHPFFLFSIWIFLPSLVFALLYLTTGLNLFVEHYLLITSLPTYLLIPALALKLPVATHKLQYIFAQQWCKFSRRTSVAPQPDNLPLSAAGPGMWRASLVFARLFLILLVSYSAYRGTWGVYQWCGHFSWGVPGGNEWRESLQQLDNPAYNAPLFLFQSPFIESNDLSYQNDPALHYYLSAPMHSFYVSGRHPRWVLLPVFWLTANEAHEKFKAEIKQMIFSQPHFFLLCNQSFWDSFSAWLEQEFSGTYEIIPESSFHSSGSLLIRQIRMVPLERRSGST